jgi:hypothetical protein
VEYRAVVPDIESSEVAGFRHIGLDPLDPAGIIAEAAPRDLQCASGDVEYGEAGKVAIDKVIYE